MSELFQTTDNVTNLIQIINIIKSGFIIFFVGEKGNTSGKIIPRALALESLDSKQFGYFFLVWQVFIVFFFCQISMWQGDLS